MSDGQRNGCRVVLVRHAVAEGNGRFTGQLDFELTTEGRSQLSHLVRELSGFPISATYASDLKRARETAAAVARYFGVPLECRPGLREMSFGQWEGLSWTEVEQKFPDEARNWLGQFPSGIVPGGESFAEFKGRISRELEFIASKNGGRYVAVVTHAGVIRVALAAASGVAEQDIFREPVPHCGLRVLNFVEQGVDLRCSHG